MKKPGPIYYKASGGKITAHGLPEPSSLRGSTLGKPEQLNINVVVTGSMQVDCRVAKPKSAVFGLNTFSGEYTWHNSRKKVKFMNEQRRMEGFCDWSQCRALNNVCRTFTFTFTL